jgi:hypothetical protein
VTNSLFRCYASNRVSHDSEVKERFYDANLELFEGIGDIRVRAFRFSKTLIQHLSCRCSVVVINSGIRIGDRRENCFIEMKIVAYGFIVPRQGRIMFYNTMTREYGRKLVNTMTNQ